VAAAAVAAVVVEVVEPLKTVVGDAEMEPEVEETPTAWE